MRRPVPFGKYCLLERISVGGMAEVFKAKQFGAEGFAKTIAIKRILPNMAEDQEFITMFIDEAKIAVQLNHANICQIYELGKIFNSHYIVMEYIPGKDLLQLNNHFKRNRIAMPVPMAGYIVSKVCEGLDYAHRKRDQNLEDIHLVHRDISPQNVLVSNGGEVKIIDFGIAKAATRTTKTQVGVLKGKFGYMSPEQVRGLPLDRRSDIFAAGTVLYEILTARRLFVADTDFATLEKVRKVDIEPPTKLRPDIPEELERIILKALAREREERYQWASEFQEDLQRFLVQSCDAFGPHEMSEWMGQTFAEETAKSKERDEYYATISSPEDLRENLSRAEEAVPWASPEEARESTVIYATAEGDPDPRPDYPLDEAAIEAALDDDDDDDDEEPTQAVAGITDEQYAEMMGESEGPGGHDPLEARGPSTPAPTAPPAPPAPPSTPATAAPPAPPIAAPAPPKANKFAANTMALSADEIEVLVEDEGEPAEEPFDPSGDTVAPDDPLMAVPREAALPKIPERVRNPIDASSASPEPLDGGTEAFKETMEPAVIRPDQLPPPPGPLSARATPPPPAAPPPPSALPPPDVAIPPPPSHPSVGPTPFSEQGTGPAFTATTKRKRMVGELIVGVVIAGVVLVGGLAAWWFFLGGAGPPVAPGTSSLALKIDPADDLEIKLDGRLVGDTSPALLEGLAPGAHVLEIRSAGHLPHKASLKLADGELSTHETTLEEGELPVGQLKLDIQPPGRGAVVNLQGASFGYDSEGSSAWIDLTASEPHKISISRPGFITQSLTVTLEPERRKTLQVTLEKLVGSIKLSSEPSGAKVFLNDKKVGKTPFKRGEIAGDKTYDIILSKKGYEDHLETVRFTSEKPAFELLVELVKKGRKPSAPKAAAGMGYLIVSAGAETFAKVFVDGEDSGLSTPIQSYNKIELPAGPHTVLLKLGGKSVEKSFEISPGETTKIRTRIR